ncbi:MAG: hybrid sensor histidine kinase/response regulator [Verrucomicrobiota bacterium]
MSYAYPDPKAAIDLLIVDDEESVCSSLSRLFRNDGLNLEVARSGDEALRLMETKPVRVLISDNRMPGLRGTELLRKSREINESTFRILLTGHAELDTLSEAINESHIHHFASKPWCPNRLRKYIFEGLASNSESLAKNRQEELTKQKLEVAKNTIRKQLETANRIGHDLRNPLNSMRLGLEIASSNLEDRDQLKYVGLSIKLIDQLTHITRQLTDLSSSRQPSEPEKEEQTAVDIGRIAEEAYMIFRPSAQAKGIALRGIDLTPGLFVEISEEALSRILFNLIGNAIKYSDGGHIGIQLFHTKNQVNLSISDSGSGISPEEQKFIFEPKQRLERHASIEGSGYGLAICKELAEAAGGAIQLKSKVSLGSVFTLSLPLANKA